MTYILSYFIGFLLAYIWIFAISYKDHGHDIVLYLILSSFWFITIPLKLGFMLYRYLRKPIPIRLEPQIEEVIQNIIKARFKYGKKFKYGK